jgi:hypothetical protein
MANWMHIKQAIDIIKSKAILKSGDMFTNEIEWEETITTILDDTGRHEDVQLFIDDHGVFIRQWNEKMKKFDLIELSHKMYHEMIEAMKHKEGAYITRWKSV